MAKRIHRRIKINDKKPTLRRKLPYKIAKVVVKKVAVPSAVAIQKAHHKAQKEIIKKVFNNQKKVHLLKKSLIALKILQQNTQKMPLTAQLIYDNDDDSIDLIEYSGSRIQWKYIIAVYAVKYSEEEGMLMI